VKPYPPLARLSVTVTVKTRSDRWACHQRAQSSPWASPSLDCFLEPRRRGGPPLAAELNEVELQSIADGATAHCVEVGECRESMFSSRQLQLSGVRWHRYGLLRPRRWQRGAARAATPPAARSLRFRPGPNQPPARQPAISLVRTPPLRDPTDWSTGPPPTQLAGRPRPASRGPVLDDVGSDPPAR
jgi:hypothetical protein